MCHTRMHIFFAHARTGLTDWTGSIYFHYFLIGLKQGFWILVVSSSCHAVVSTQSAHPPLTSARHVPPHSCCSLDVCSFRGAVAVDPGDDVVSIPVDEAVGETFRPGRLAPTSTSRVALQVTCNALLEIPIGLERVGCQLGT